MPFPCNNCSVARGRPHRLGAEAAPSVSGRYPTSPHTVINPVQLAMVVEGRPDDGTVLDQYPGFDLSISELCHALKIKLAQTRDSRYAYAAVGHLLLNHQFSSPL